jgi:DNA-binding transcriptional MerR regulator
MSVEKAVTETFTITDLAGEFKVTPRTIRFYEDKGLLAPERNGLARVYTRRDRGRLKLILRGRRLGFSLAELKEMLNLYDLDDGQVEQRRVLLKRARKHLTELEAQRRDINDTIRELKGVIEHVVESLRAEGINERAA